MHYDDIMTRMKLWILQAIDDALFTDTKNPFAESVRETADCKISKDCMWDAD